MHDFIGGHMSDLTCAPADPLFWLQHAFIDCVFEKFRRYSQYTWPEKDYPVGMYGELSNEHKAYAFMEPFRPTYNIHGLSNHYTNYYYQCAPRPVHCKSDAECESPYLWCDAEAYRCRSKIKMLGRCDSLPNSACEGDSQCYRNVCSKPFQHMDHSSYYTAVVKDSAAGLHGEHPDQEAAHYDDPGVEQHSGDDEQRYRLDNQQEPHQIIPDHDSRYRPDTVHHNEGHFQPGSSIHDIVLDPHSHETAKERHE